MTGSTNVWTPRYAQSLDLARCRAAVAEGGRGVGFHQCGKKAVVFREEIGWCKQHDPEAVAAKHKQQEARWRQERADENAKQQDGEKRAQALGAGTPHYAAGFGSRMGGYTGGVVLTAEEADALIARLEKITVAITKGGA